ncbi:glycosyltransferase, partial [Patescibacteria group bacterium]|nr:glycosyltransferase [Patescibacteria group bacterium]
RYQDIPGYLKAFDVALIPFKINPLIKATNPVKIYEYFSQNKPVVSTYLPELKKYKKLLYLSKTHSDFIKNIRLALKEKLNNQKRVKVSISNQWSAKAKEISTQLDKFFDKVSIVILTYNGPKMSKDSIDTVLNRSFYPNKEVIVVDNASKPETVKMLKKYKNHPEIKLILNKENYGFAKGNNIGTRLATGEYIILLNNDILAIPGWIERLTFHASTNKNIGLVGPVTNSIGNEAKIDIEYDHTNTRQMERRISKYTSRHWGETIELNNLAAFCWVCPKHVYQEIGELDDRFGRGMFEDDDYCYRVKKAGYKILCAEDAFTHHFGGASFNKIITDEYKKLFEDNKLKFENKWQIKWVPHQYRKELK